MGFILSKILEFFTKNRNDFKIIILGVQNAGKTTILYRLSLGQLIKTTPTIGSNVEELTYDNVKIQAWDLGGQETTRSVWDVYFMNTDGVIYVIDSQSDEFFEESKSEFHKLLKNHNLKNSVILIFANKQDLPGAKSVNKLIEGYEFNKIKNHLWHIQGCSAIKGDGLNDGIKWLSEQLVFRGKNNFPNNPYINEDVNQNDNEDQEYKNKIQKSENNEIKLTVNNTENRENANNIINDNDNINENNIENKDDNNIK